MKKDFIKPAVFLLLVAVISASILGVTYTMTEGPIREQRARAETAAVVDLLPETYFTEAVYLDIYNSSLTRVMTSFNADGEIIGYVFAASPVGYSGAINMLVAVSPHGIVEGVRVIRHTETPGLGANITQDWFLNQFPGRSGFLSSSRSAAGADEIQIIASATISVEAVLRGVNDATEYFHEFVRQ